MEEGAARDQVDGAKRRRVEGRPLVLLDVALPESLQMRLEETCEVILLSNEALWEPRRAKVLAVFSYQHVSIDAPLLSRLPNIKVVSNFGAGYDHIDSAACFSRGVPLGNTPGVVADATADLALGLALAGTRNLVAGHTRYHVDQSFDPNWWGDNFTGATVGIVGLGNIGKKVAQRLKAFRSGVLR